MSAMGNQQSGGQRRGVLGPGDWSETNKEEICMPLRTPVSCEIDSDDSGAKSDDVGEREGRTTERGLAGGGWRSGSL